MEVCVDVILKSVEFISSSVEEAGVFRWVYYVSVQHQEN